jgi:predicted NBD/HSP70 family sugar kinase
MTQSTDDEVTLTVVNVGGEPIWEACGGGHCVRDHSGAMALERLKLVRRASPSRSQPPAPPNA